MTRLTVAYDANCALCRRARRWLESQAQLVPLEFVAAGSPAATARFPGITVLGSELVVGDERGQVWTGPNAFVMCLWATADHRALARRISSPALAPIAEKFFEQLSSNRGALGRVFGDPECDDGTCNHRRAGATYAPPAAPSAKL